MAKKRSENQDRKVLSLAMRKHIELFVSEWRYKEWCSRNGFRSDLDKTSKEIATEQAALDAQKRCLEINAKLHRNPKKLIEEMCLGRITSADIDRPQWRELAQIIEKSASDARSRESLLKLLLRVHAVADFLFGQAEFAGLRFPYAKALVHLNERRGEWRRDSDAWKSATHNAQRQFASLVRHLVADYPVPPFMDQAWFRDGEYGRHVRDWYMHVGAGKNIRTARTPVPLTKMMAHHMMLAPDSYSIAGAIRWGQVHAFGGDRRLTDALVGTRVGENFANDEFWLSVFRFFIANPMLDRSQVGPVIDFLHHQKFEGEEIRGEDGRLHPGPPPQPNLSMRGRTAETLLAQMDKWHRELGRMSDGTRTVFPRSGFNGLDMATGRDGENRWTIRELISRSDLRREGQSMRHCVASYARSCASGRCSIWSMEFASPLGTEKRQTVEVSSQGQIVQSRGKFNRLPTSGEFTILEAWASRAGLRIAPFVRAAG